MILFPGRYRVRTSRTTCDGTKLISDASSWKSAILTMRPRCQNLQKVAFKPLEWKSSRLQADRFITRLSNKSDSPRRVVRAESRDLHVEPPEVGTATRPPTIRPRAQLNEKATFIAQNLNNCKGANMD